MLYIGFLIHTEPFLAPPAIIIMKKLASIVLFFVREPLSSSSKTKRMIESFPGFDFDFRQWCAFELKIETFLLNVLAYNKVAIQLEEIDYTQKSLDNPRFLIELSQPNSCLSFFPPFHCTLFLRFVMQFHYAKEIFMLIIFSG